MTLPDPTTGWFSDAQNQEPLPEAGFSLEGSEAGESSAATRSLNRFNRQKNRLSGELLTDPLSGFQRARRARTDTTMTAIAASVPVATAK